MPSCNFLGLCLLGLRERSTTALFATCQFAICAQSSKGMKKQAVGKQENVLLIETPLTEMTGFTTFWSRHVEIDYIWVDLNCNLVRHK